MKIKRTLVSAIAALGLAASVMAPVAMAQPTENGSGSNTTTAEVTVADDGTFDVYFASTTLDLTDVTLSALTPNGTATGKFRISYVDTLSDRPNFDITVYAPSFQDETGNNFISSDGFKVTGTYNVVQFQWGNPPSTNKNAYCFPGNPLEDPALCALYPYPVGSDIGDIGYFVDGVYPSAGQAEFTEWLASPGLDTSPTVHFGYAGVGTHWSHGDVDVALDVPAGTVPGIYTSDLLLSVIPGTR